MTGWAVQNGKEEAPEPQIYTNSQVEQWLKAGQKTTASKICVVLYGHDGVCKTGAAMDCYKEEDLKAGKQIIVFDLDGSAGPIKSSYHKNSENIVIFDPFVLTEKGEIDYVSTYNKILAVVRYLNEKESELKLHAIIFDGLDTLLKICEYVMRYEDLKLDPNTQIKDSWQWQRRNKRYLTVVLLLKKLKCMKFFTTHLKEEKKWVSAGTGKRELTVEGYHPDWEKSTPGIMFQKVLLDRKPIAENGEVVFEAVMEKAKGALHLEGKTYTIARVMQGGDTEWMGLKQMIKELESESAM